VIAHITIEETGAGSRGDARSEKGVVLWLTPADASSALAPIASHAHFQVAQINKHFQPALLVIPVGSVVDFPNLDPYFHNVFSLFNGRKFDLGLYEKGQSRSVRFDRPGVSFIFCDIHPEMSAVVVSVPTLYFASSVSGGSLVIHGVTPGSYDAHLWAVGSGDNLSSAQNKRVAVGDRETDLGTFVVRSSASESHKNKFGEDYDVQHAEQY
jgi:plastocyanin